MTFVSNVVRSLILVVEKIEEKRIIILEKHIQLKLRFVTLDIEAKKTLKHTSSHVKLVQAECMRCP